MNPDTYYIVTDGYGFADIASREHEDKRDAVEDYLDRLQRGVCMFEVTPYNADEIRKMLLEHATDA